MRVFMLIFFLVASLISNAQKEKIWGDPHVYERFAQLAGKNPAYTKMVTELVRLGNTANPGNTNATAVKSLLEANRTILKNLYDGAGMLPPRPASMRTMAKTGPVLKKTAPIFKSLPPAAQALTQVRTPPFDDNWLRRSGHSNDGGYPDTISSQFNTGKIVMTATSRIPPCDLNPGWGGCKLGFCEQGYFEKFTVPSNPQIIAAEVKVEYSYLYTGWDTYGSITGLELVVRADNKFNSSSYNELPDGPNGPNEVQPTDRWKKMATLYALDSVDTDFSEFHANGESSFTIEGYVTPGSDFEIRVGFGFPAGTKRGTMGCYHYAEFIVKKITVNYYKSAN